MSHCAAGAPAIADAEPWRAAYAAAGEVIEVQTLGDRAARLYHDPVIRQLAGADLDYYFQNPGVAYEALKAAAAKGALPGDLGLEAMEVALTGQDFNTEQGVSEQPAQAPALPAGEAEQASAYGALIKASLAGSLSAAERSALDRLASAKVGRAADVAEAPPAAPAAPSEYDQLISKSVNGGGLTTDEHARLTGLATARAESTGRLDPADVEPQFIEDE